jgi:glycerophosphoryl diester phosphodiesterase/dienelactone hydrolase
MPGCRVVTIASVALGLALNLAVAPLQPPAAAQDDPATVDLAPFFTPPPEFATALGAYRSPLVCADGRPVSGAVAWSQRRREIRAAWDALLGPWPPLLAAPELEILSSEPRETFMQHRVRVQVAPAQRLDGYLLVPPGAGPFPAVVVPYYEPETSVGLKGKHRDFALQLTRRGFVTLSIGSPGGDARRPDLAGATCQPLSYLGCIAANCHTALARRADVDPRRIGIVGHSYGGKWALFGACLDDRFACAVWCDPGIVFDEARGNVNYQEPWYLGLEAGRTRTPGLVTPDNPRTGAYATLVARGHDLHELHALMAPRPFLVSGGAEDFPSRWTALNHTRAVNDLLGARDRVAMTNRPTHAPTPESNAQIVAFFTRFLAPAAAEACAVAHRGLLREAPENTLPNFRACLDAHLGFEFDVRRCRDGALVCLHDDTLDRTTDGSGPIAGATRAEITRLDAGGWFAPEFRDARVPAVDDVLALVAAHPAAAGVYAVDLKAEDVDVERDVVALAARHGVLDRLLFIGRAIDRPDVRRRLRAADAGCHVAALANRREELAAALAAADADWAYLRFVPTAADVAAVRAAGRRAIVAGPAVAGREEANWAGALAAGVDAILTDFPIEARRAAAR